MAQTVISRGFGLLQRIITRGFFSGAPPSPDCFLAFEGLIQDTAGFQGLINDDPVAVNGLINDDPVATIGLLHPQVAFEGPLTDKAGFEGPLTDSEGFEGELCDC